MGNFIEGAKNIANNVKNFAKSIIKAIKFFTTTIGQIVGMIILVLALILVIYVISETVQHAIGMWLNDDYAGIATTEDYETIVGGIGYTGYDSFISEEKWQEYAAFEYAVLMDVAEHMYEYQDYVTTVKVDGEEYYTSAVFPEGVVKSQYDAYNISKDEWRNMAIQGQGGTGPKIQKADGKEILGGNRDVTAPRLVYEMADHEYESDAVSLMPYVVIVRENLELNYYLNGLSNAGGYSNKAEISAGDLSNIEPVRYSAELNRYNYNMPNSGFKSDLKEDQNGNEVVGLEDPEGFIDADRYSTGYGDDVYYTEQETDIVYKIPLKLLINRYLPKSTLLTTWYMLKQDDISELGFKIDDLMDTIKEIYNSACYADGMNVPSITTTGKKDAETGAITSEGSGITLRTGTETLNKETVDNAVQFNDYGDIKRDEDGKAILGPKEIEYATTNKRTFIYFEQFGLETSRYESYKAYKDAEGDEANPNPKSVVATYLTREKVNFIETINIHFDAIYYWDVDESGDLVLESMPYDVRLKPTYSFMQEPGVELDEKFKSQYLAKEYGGNTGPGSVQQDAPYSFMATVVSDAEGKVGNKTFTKDLNKEDGSKIFENHFINKEYIIAEDGNAGKAGAPDANTNPEQVRYRLPEDFRYYNQDDAMPHWYDFLGESYSYNKGAQKSLEKAYLDAFRDYCEGGGPTEGVADILAMLSQESGIEIVGYDDGKSIKYTYENDVADLYNGSKHVSNMEEIRLGNYQVNYYWKPVYLVEEKELQIEQKVHHVRMPALLVKYCDFWAKSVEYTNTVIQNPIDYKNYKHLIPNSVTSLGMTKMDLNEKASYRVETFKEYFNKSDNSLGAEGIKEGDVLDMLVQWEEYANKGGDEVAYAYMRELYKLVINIRDHGNTMLDSAYNYLYIPSTISNFDDSTLQKVFWLERLGTSKGDDELTKEEQSKMRTKALDIKWQNVEYDEYYECIYDVGDTEEANVYALFPFGAPVVRAYYMLRNWDEIITNGYSASHGAIDMYSRAFAKDILYRGSEEGKLLYFYELNRLTLSYMQNGNSKQDAFKLAEKTLNSQLEEYVLNSPIVSIAPGYVTKVDFDARSGFYVEVTHDSGDKAPNQVKSLYVHFKRWPLVEVGDVVGAGTILGYEGTTGRSTGNHLHIELTVDGQKVDPKDYILPVFSPFYYDIKAKAVLEEDAKNALGSEYYTLERTILPELALFNSNNVINGMTLSTGEVINYTAPTNKTKLYASGDYYNSGDNPNSNRDDEGLSPYNVIWGNNVPDKELAKTLDDIIDLNLLNQTIAFEMGKNDNPSGEKLSYEKDVTASPEFFCADKTDFESKYKFAAGSNIFDENGSHIRNVWPKWFAEEMAEYNSELTVPYYNGPESKNDVIATEEAFRDLMAIQDSLKKAGYYAKAGVDFEDAGYGVFTELFEKVVRTMQKDLVEKGYGVYDVKINGKLDINTVAAYNTMLNYTTATNQYAMSEKTAYNAPVDISLEPAIIWGIIATEGEDGNKDELALKESGDKNGVTLKYDSYMKNFNKDQGLMQINPSTAIEKYSEDNISSNKAVINIRRPMQNTKVASELIKEYMLYFYENYKAEIERAKNDIVFGRKASGYFYDHVYTLGYYYEYRWCDSENIDRVMLYALSLEAYDKKGVTEVNVNDILTNGPTQYAKDVLGRALGYIIETK